MFKFIPKEVPAEVASDIKTIKEEIANMVSHGFGAILFLVLSPLLLVSAKNASSLYYFWGCVVFCASLLMVYVASTLYHSVYNEKLRHRLRIFDHISIYFIISGSYTPFILTYFRDQRGLTILTVLYAMTIIGSILKLYFTHKFQIASTIVYIIMGYLALLIWEPLKTTITPLSFQLIILGGVSYTVGVVFYLWEKLYHNHLIWHIFVLGGSVAHFFAVYYLV